MFIMHIDRFEMLCQMDIVIVRITLCMLNDAKCYRVVPVVKKILMKDGVEIGRARPHAGAHNMGSNFFVVHCQEHESVWVKIGGKASCVFHARFNYNTFSAIRLG